VSGTLLALTYEGRRTGRSHTIPVMYARDDAGLIVFAGRAKKKQWWRNLAQPAAVHVGLRGHDRRGTAAIMSDTAARAVYEQRFPRAKAAIAAEMRRRFVAIDIGQAQAASARSSSAITLARRQRRVSRQRDAASTTGMNPQALVGAGLDATMRPPWPAGPGSGGKEHRLT
jgi:hypothetical protein